MEIIHNAQLTYNLSIKTLNCSVTVHNAMQATLHRVFQEKQSLSSFNQMKKLHISFFLDSQECCRLKLQSVHPLDKLHYLHTSTVTLTRYCNMCKTFQFNKLLSI